MPPGRYAPAYMAAPTLTPEEEARLAAEAEAQRAADAQAAAAAQAPPPEQYQYVEPTSDAATSNYGTYTEAPPPQVAADYTVSGGGESGGSTYGTPYTPPPEEYRPTPGGVVYPSGSSGYTPQAPPAPAKPAVSSDSVQDGALGMARPGYPSTGGTLSRPMPSADRGIASTPVGGNDTLVQEDVPVAIGGRGMLPPTMGVGTRSSIYDPSQPRPTGPRTAPGVAPSDANRYQRNPGVLTPHLDGDFVKNELGRALGLNPESDVAMYDQGVIAARDMMGRNARDIQGVPQGLGNVSRLVTLPLGMLADAASNISLSGPPLPEASQPNLPNPWGGIEDAVGAWGQMPRGALEHLQPIGDAIAANRAEVKAGYRYKTDPALEVWQSGPGAWFNDSFMKSRAAYEDDLAAGTVVTPENKFEAGATTAANAEEMVDRWGPIAWGQLTGTGAPRIQTSVNEQVANVPRPYQAKDPVLSERAVMAGQRLADEFRRNSSDDTYFGVDVSDMGDRIGRAADTVGGLVGQAAGAAGRGVEQFASNSADDVVFGVDASDMGGRIGQIPSAVGGAVDQFRRNGEDKVVFGKNLETVGEDFTDFVNQANQTRVVPSFDAAVNEARQRFAPGVSAQEAAPPVPAYEAARNRVMSDGRYAPAEPSWTDEERAALDVPLYNESVGDRARGAVQGGVNTVRGVWDENTTPAAWDIPAAEAPFILPRRDAPGSVPSAPPTDAEINAALNPPSWQDRIADRVNRINTEVVRPTATTAADTVSDYVANSPTGQNLIATGQAAGDWARRNVLDPLAASSADTKVFNQETQPIIDAAGRIPISPEAVGDAISRLAVGVPGAVRGAIPTGGGATDRPNPASDIYTLPNRDLSQMTSDELASNVRPQDIIWGEDGTGDRTVPGTIAYDANGTPIGFSTGTGLKTQGSNVSMPDFEAAVAAARKGKGGKSAAAGAASPTTTGQPAAQSDTSATDSPTANKTTKTTTQSTQSAPSSSPTTTAYDYDTSYDTSYTRPSTSRSSSSTQTRGTVGDMFASDDDSGLNIDDFTNRDWDNDGKVTSKDRSIGKKRYAAERAKRSKKKKGFGTSGSTIPVRADSPLRTQILDTFNTSFNKKKPR